jgi:hypothetical protein
MQDDALTIRLPKSLRAALRERERLTMVPTSRFVRSLIEQALPQFLAHLNTEEKEQSNGNSNS